MSEEEKETPENVPDYYRDEPEDDFPVERPTEEPAPKRSVEIGAGAYEKYENTATIQHLSVETFIEVLSELIMLPPGEAGLLCYRQALHEAPTDWWQIRQNIRRIVNGKSVDGIRTMAEAIPRKRVALVICNGPSLSAEQLELIKKSSFRQRDWPVFCVDSAAAKVLKEGIVPDYIIHLDNAIYAREFYKDPVMQSDLNRRLKYIVPIDMHPEVLEHIRGEIYWFNIAAPEFPTVNKNLYLKFMFPEIPLLDSGGNVGMFSIILAEYLHCDTVCVVGMDFSMPEGTRPEDCENYHLDVLDCGGQPHFGDDGKVAWAEWPCGTERCPNNAVFDGLCTYNDVEHDRGECLCEKELKSQYVYVKDPYGNTRMIEKVYDTYVQILENRMKALKARNKDFRLVNCTGAGLAYVDGVERKGLEEFFQEIGVL